MIAYAVVVGSGAFATAGHITFSNAVGPTRPLAVFENSADAARLAESMLNRRAKVVRVRIEKDE